MNRWTAVAVRRACGGFAPPAPSGVILCGTRYRERDERDDDCI